MPNPPSGYTGFRLEVRPPYYKLHTETHTYYTGTLYAYGYVLYTLYTVYKNLHVLEHAHFYPKKSISHMQMHTHMHEYI